MEIRAIKINEIGPVPRRMKSVHRAAAKTAYRSVGEEFHTRFAHLRFTVQHGKAAGYKPRAGERLPWGSKAFWQSYFGRKMKGGKLPGGRYRPGTTAPLVWSGDTRAAARIATIAPTSNRAEVRYTLRALNFIPWAREEFSRVLDPEAVELGHVFDNVYHVEFNGDNQRGTIIIQ